MKLLDFINKQTNNAYLDFKLVSVIFDRENRACTFKFLYKNELKDGDKDVLQKLITEYLPQKVDVVVKCKKAYVDKDLVRDVIYNFVMKQSILDNIIGLTIFPLIFFIIDKLILILVKDEKKLPIGMGDIKYVSVIGLMFGFSFQILSIIFIRI